MLAFRAPEVETNLLVDKLHIASLDYELMRLFVVSIEIVEELLFDLLVPIVPLEEGKPKICGEVPKIAHVELDVVSDTRANIHPCDHPHELLERVVVAFVYYVYGYVIYRH